MPRKKTKSKTKSKSKTKRTTRKRRILRVGSDYEIYIGLITKNGRYVKNAVDKLKRILLREGILGYTQIRARGFWKGKGEPSLIVSFINTYNLSGQEVKRIAKKIKRAFRQESVLLVRDRIKYTFVE